MSAVDVLPAAEESARGRVRTRGDVIHETELGVRLGVIAKLQLAHETGRIALIVTLQVVGGGVVVSRVLRHDLPGRVDLVRFAGGRVVEHSRRRVARAAADIGPGAGRAACRRQHAGRMVAVIGRDGRGSTIAQVALHVPGAVGKRLTQDDREVFVIAVPIGAVDRGKVLGLEERIDPRGMIAMVVNPEVRIQSHSLEMVVHDEVDDAGDGIRAVGRRRAAGEDIDPLNQSDRNLVDVRGRGKSGSRAQCRPRVTTLQPATVDQHQGSLCAKPAQIQGSCTVRTHRQARALIGHNLRQTVQQVFNAHHPGGLDLLARDSSHGADRVQIRGGDARPGDDNFLEYGLRGCVGLRRLRLRKWGLHHTRSKSSRTEQRCTYRAPENGVHFRGHIKIAP